MRSRGSGGRELLAFLLLWPMTGFTLGLATLFGPVVWLTGAAREAHLPQSGENALVALIVIVLVAGSALVATRLARGTCEATLRHVRFGIPALAALCTAGAVWLSLTPSVMAYRGAEDFIGPHFTIGPYPDLDMLERLKDEGYTAVISLLHPAVIPFEPQLLAQEKKNAAAAGLALIELPMLPWVSGNEAALDRVEALARNDEGRYYIHCYLGRDRVSRVRRIIEQYSPAVDLPPIEPLRELKNATPFERGPVTELTQGVYLTPFPGEEEIASYFAAGTVASVVTLLDPEIGDDREWLEMERRILSLYNIPLVVRPIPIERYDPFRALEIAKEAWTRQRPLVVHAFLPIESGRSPAAEAFQQAFLTGRPPLPPSLFAEPMSEGDVTIIAPDIAVGPRPTPSEFGAYLYARGIREFVRVGDPDEPSASEDAAVARAHGFPWRAWDPASGDLLAFDASASTSRPAGPWYLYGPALETIRASLVERYGPALPVKLSWDGDAYRREVLGLAGPGGARLDPVAFARQAIPRPELIVLLGPVLMLAVAVAAGFVGDLRVSRLTGAPYTRKVFHFIIFTFAAAIHLMAGLPGVVLLGVIVSGCVLYAVVRGPGFPLYEAMARPSDAPRRTLFIVVPLIATAVGGLLANFFFAPFAFVGYLVGGWGDAIGEPVGTAWGRHRYRAPSLGGVRVTRSLEGSAAVLLLGTAAAALGLWAYGLEPATALAVGAVCGGAGAAVEALSNHGLDNLTIQIAAAATAFLLLS